MSLDRVRSVELKNPEPTARVMGRYALELWIGSEMLDRLRFNVPLGGNLPREEDGRPFKRPSFDKVTARFKVRIAAQPRATYLKLVDRATNQEKRFLWPPTSETLTPYPESDAGGADAGGADAGRADAGRADAGRADASKPDAKAPDGGKPGANAPDGGKPGGGSKDGGAAPAPPAPPGSAKPDAGPAPDAGGPDSGSPDAGKPDDGPLVPRRPPVRILK